MKTSLVLFLVFLNCAVFDAASATEYSCADYLAKTAGHSVGIVRVESLLSKQTRIIDVSASITERRAKSDPKLRVINLTDFLSEGVPFIGFGRPNVFIAIPGVGDKGLGYVKVDAKSLKRADTQIVPTLDRVQSGLLATFPELPEGASERIFKAAESYVGTRRWTCVNTNCQILSDAGFTVGGETLANYYFPVPLLRDILRYGLEFEGRPVNFDLIKTTPGYLEDIGLSINHAVYSTLCRHAERACEPIRKNTFMVKVNNGLQSKFGVAIFDAPQAGAIPAQKFETDLTRISVAPSVRVPYNLEVSEPSQFGSLLRLLWGPHSLFEVPLPEGIVDQYLPKTLQSFPDPNPSFSTRAKKNILFNPSMVKLIRSQLSSEYKKIEGLPHDLLFDMLRTDSDEFPNKYNFVVTGDRLIIMKLDIRNGYVDWILSKHVLMSGYSQDVRFAGEIWKTADGVIHLNNNSGTYKPGADLSTPAKFFQALFPGLAVEMRSADGQASFALDAD